MALTQTQEECLGMSGVETSGFRPLGDPCFPGEGCGNDSGDCRTGNHARRVGPGDHTFPEANYV